MKYIQFIIFCVTAMSIIVTQYQTWQTNSYRSQCVKEYSELIPNKAQKYAIAFAVNFCNGGNGVFGDNK
jgi:hypothetical protein